LRNESLKFLKIRSVKHLCYLLKTTPEELDKICNNLEGFYYSQTKIDSKGKPRQLDTPQGGLREILDNLNVLLQRVELPGCIHGGCKGHSTRTNAGPHIGQPLVMVLDIKSFFPSVRPSMVYDLFWKRLECSKTVSNYLKKLTTYKGCLPQGSPTSAIVGALVAEPVSRRLQGLAKQHGANFTQYVDDITFSGPPHLQRLKKTITKIVQQAGLSINYKKTAVMPRNTEQNVTGIRVNTSFDAPSEKIKQAKKIIDQFEARGTNPTDKELASIKGKINYIGSLNRGAGNNLHSRLARVLIKIGPKNRAA
jgi:RNA-directed DNA polymerase